MSARATLDAAISEADFQRQVIALAEAAGWLVYHTRDSRGSQQGFPDLVMVHPERARLLFVELKTERGRLSSDQLRWLRTLGIATSAAGPCAHVCLWRPSDWPEIERVLTGP